MYFYAQINSERIAFGVTQTPTKIEHPDLIELPAFDDAVVGKAHNADTGQWLSVMGPPERRNVSRKAFLSRFTDAEAIDIDMASMGATREAAAVRRYLSKVNAAQHIDLADDETRTGVQGLEAAGLLQPGRALVILDAPIQPKELP